jgi:hypothetical protein
MTHSYSLDLRVRVAAFVEAGHSRRAAARHFKVSDSFAIKLMQRQRQCGSPAPARQGRPRGTGKLACYEAFLIRTVEARPDITMPELAARLLDEQGLAGLGAAPADQGQQAGQVVEGEGRAGLQAHAVGQGQHALGWGADDLLPAAGRHQDRDALAGGQAQVGPGGADRAGGVHARGERQRHLELVGPGGLEQVGERHSGGDHVDDHPVVGPRLPDLGPLNRVWAREGHDPMSEHLLLPSALT